ncbi:hypothetical protein STEG23_012435, partial [Scotinomys teguina]
YTVPFGLGNSIVDEGYSIRGDDFVSFQEAEYSDQTVENKEVSQLEVESIGPIISSVMSSWPCLQYWTLNLSCGTVLISNQKEYIFKNSHSSK